MASGRLDFQFTSNLVRIAHFHALPVPETAAAAWKKGKVRRLVGTINGHPVKRALMSHADGGSFLYISHEIMKQAGLGFKAAALMKFRPDPAPNRPDVPVEFQVVLEQDDAARERWKTFTVGRQRSLLVYVTTAKTEPTRIKRAVELARRIGQHALYGDRPQKPAPPRPPR